MKRAAAVLVALLLPFALAAQCGTTVPGKPLPTTHCEEDQPCWNCTTMGNGRCGTDGSDL